MTKQQDGPSQARRTLVIHRFKTLHLLKIWYMERFSERRDGSAGRTVTDYSVEIESLNSETEQQDGPSQARRAVTGCVIPG